MIRRKLFVIDNNQLKAIIKAEPLKQAKKFQKN